MDTNVNKQLEQDQYSSFPDFQHLNIDLCWELICPYLNLNDLSSVADSCLQMRRAAELTFAHKYRKQFICVCNSEEEILQKSFYSYHHFFDFDNKIILSKPKICFRVLRCFGQMISKLCCIENSTSTGAFWSYFEKYIANHCTSYLTQLEMWNRRASCVNLEATFPNVERLCFINCKLNKTTTEFNKRYPQMRSLEFATEFFPPITEVSDERCIVDHFPNLEHLSLDILGEIPPTSGVYTTPSIFQDDTVLKALELNPQLRSLDFNSKYENPKPIFFQKVSEKCELLVTLQLDGYSLRYSDVAHFANVKSFKLINSDFALRKPIPLTFNALEIFDCYSLSPAALPHIFDFVRKNPSMSKMKFSFCSECLTHDTIIEMKNAFASVKELEIKISVYMSSSEEISDFLNGFKSVLKLTLKPTLPFKFEPLLEMIKLLPQIPWIIDEKNETIKYNKVN